MSKIIKNRQSPPSNILKFSKKPTINKIPTRFQFSEEYVIKLWDYSCQFFKKKYFLFRL